MMTRRAQLANLDIDPGRRIGLYVYERVNEEGQVTRGIFQVRLSRDVYVVEIVLMEYSYYSA